MIWLLVIIGVSLVAAWFWYSSHSHLKRLIEEARKAEANGQYESAVLHYGEALYGYAKPAEFLRMKIREIWTSHGPFEFSEARKELVNRKDVDRDGDLSIFDDTIRVIRQVTVGNIEKREFET